MRRRGPALARAVAATLVAAVACGAGALPAFADGVAPNPTGAALGFGAPHRVSLPGVAVSNANVTIAPTGRTLVTWLAEDPKSGGYLLVTAFGDSVDRLGAPTVANSVVPLQTSSGLLTPVALSDGSFAVCAEVDDAKVTSLQCSFAPPGQGFGPLVTIDTQPTSAEPDYRVTARPGGTLVFLLAHNTSAKATVLTTASVNGAGVLGPVHPLATITAPNELNITALNDGTVALSWSEGDYFSPHVPSVRLMAPGSDDVGGPVAAGLPTTVAGGVLLMGGNQLRLQYEVAGGGRNATRVIVRHADGSFAAPAYLPTSKDFYVGTTLELADGSIFAVTASVFGTIGCGGVQRASVGVGPLTATPTPPTILSAKGQLPDPGSVNAGTLADGTVIVEWTDPFAHGEKAQVEAAIRPAGATAFKRAQVLPGASSSEGAFDANGDQAILTWVIGDGKTSRVVVSTLRRSAPYAAQAKRPKHPSVVCK